MERDQIDDYQNALSSPVPLDEVNDAISVIGRLKLSDPIRRIAVAFIRGEPIATFQPVTAELMKTDAGRWRQRTVAAWILGRAKLSPEELDSTVGALLDVLERSRREPLAKRLFRVLLRGYSLGAGLGLFIWWTWIWGRGGAGYYDIGAFTAMLFFFGTSFSFAIAPAALFLDKYREDRVRAACARALGHIRAPEAVGALASGIFDSSSAVREEAATALHEVLPNLSESNYGEIGAQSMVNLGRALGHPDGRLVSRILSALTVVGTAHALPYVEKSANRGRTMRVRDQAAEVLKILQARQNLEMQNERLLRPARTVDEPANLLRPIQMTETIDLQQLLRPIEEDTVR